MIFLVGLGNPGKKYQNNRHNVGYQFVDYLVKLLNGQIVKNKKNNLVIYQFSNLFLVKTDCFMNESGIFVKKLTTNYQLLTTNLIIAHDDLDIPFGKFHIQFAVGPHLHNGLESIEKNLKTKDFWRIRIGVDNRKTGEARCRIVPGETYVLQNFTLSEKILLEKEIFPKIFIHLKTFLCQPPSTDSVGYRPNTIG